MHIEIFQGEEYTGMRGTKLPGLWYWRFRNKGRVTANNESFPSKSNATRAAKGVVKATLKETGYDHPTFTARQVEGGITRIDWA